MGEYLGRMATQENNDDRIALLQEAFLVDHGSLYVALQRLENKKWISAKWGVSENNRKARFYSLTTKGREQLVEKIGEWRRLAPATGLILEPGSRLLGEEA
jgi:PadR family transcriptional regulator, regulatory protein PadR